MVENRARYTPGEQMRVASGLLEGIQAGVIGPEHLQPGEEARDLGRAQKLLHAQPLSPGVV